MTVLLSFCCTEIWSVWSSSRKGEVGRSYFDKRPNNSKRGEAQVLKGTSFGCGVQEGVQEEWDMSYRKMRMGGQER